MAQISIIGTGNMAQGLKALFERGENTVELLEKDQLATANFAPIVVFAVPFRALDDIAGKYADKLAGKTLVDITNPVDFATMSPISVAEGSAAQHLQALIPAAHVVKAFNTNFAGTLASGKVGVNNLTVLVASDDEAAKQSVIDAVKADDSAQALDAGVLARARELEAMGYLQISLAANEQVAWTNGFAVVR